VAFFFTYILLFLEADLTSQFYTLVMINKITEIIESAMALLRRIIREESESLDRFYAQYE